MIISIGMTIKAIYSDFELFIDDHFMSPPTLMVAIGILLLFVSSFGCVGAIKESTMLINVVCRSAWNASSKYLTHRILFLTP